MESKIEIIGNESSVIYYNLNKQFSNLDKLILTGDIVLSSFETAKIKGLFEKLKITPKQSYLEVLKETKDEAFDDLIRNELYQEIQERLKKLTDGINDIQLKDYNFMSSVSNTKYNVMLRCEDFSITMFYEEKGQIISAIRKLIIKYLEFEGNLFRIPRLDHFQIEIIETEELYKHVFLKKESDRLILTSSFGFPYHDNIDFDIGSEFYFSIGKDFKFYKNSQTHAILRDHTKLEEKEINQQEKILSNDELVKINEITKNINDALIEMTINAKGKIKILNVSLLENSIYNNSEEGIIINKSTKNYSSISLLTLRDTLEEEYTNPKYLLIRNNEEVKEFFRTLRKVNFIDGIIFNVNFYSPILDLIGKELNIDIIYYKTPLQRSLEVKIDFNELYIESYGSSGNEMFGGNPFSNILDEQKKENDLFLEKLKNIDLSTPQQQSRQEFQDFNIQQLPQSQQGFHDISSIAQGIISSPESSTKKQGISWGETPSLKKTSITSGTSAIGMLADSVLSNNSKPIMEEKKSHQQHNLNEYGQSDLVMNNINSKQLNPIDDYNQTIQNFENIPTPQQQQPVQQPQQNKEPLKILTMPNINSGHYFTDINSITQVTEGEIYFMTTNPEEITNSNLKYVFPISTVENPQDGSYLIVNSTQDFFLIDRFQNNNKFFISLSHIEDVIKNEFIENCIKKLRVISLIITKNDLDLLMNHVKYIEEVFIKDLESQQEFDQIKRNLVGTTTNPSTTQQYNSLEDNSEYPDHFSNFY